MAKDATYQKHLSDKTLRLRAAEAKLKATREMAQLVLDRATQDGYRQQVEAWRAEQIAAIEATCRASLAAAYPEAYAAFDKVMDEAQQEYTFETEDAEAEYEHREQQRRAVAAAARAAAKQARWLASPAGQKLERDRAEQLRRETGEFEQALARGLWPSHWCRWWVEAELAMGVLPAQAEQDYVRTAAWRAQYLQRWPDQHAAVEGVDRAPWDALASVRRP